MRQFAAQVVGIDGKVRIPSVGCFFQKIRNGYYYFQFDQPLQLERGDSLDITCLDDKRTQCLGISTPTTLLAINLPVDAEGEVKFFNA